MVANGNTNINFNRELIMKKFKYTALLVLMGLSFYGGYMLQKNVYISYCETCQTKPVIKQMALSQTAELPKFILSKNIDSNEETDRFWAERAE